MLPHTPLRRLVQLSAGLLAPILAGAAEGQTMPLDSAALATARIGDTVRCLTTDGPVDVIVEREVHRRDESRTLIARRADGRGTAVMSRFGDAVAGYLTGTGGTWRWDRRAPNGPHFVRAASDFTCGVPHAHGLAAHLDRPNDDTPAAGLDPCPDQGDVHDVLVLYSKDVETAWGGDAATRAEIDAVIATSNLALESSATAPRFRLALAWPSDAADSLSLGELTNPTDGVADHLHDLRDLVAADQVVLLFDGGGGVANGVWMLDPEQASNAFCRAGINSFPYVFTHELGHNMGCCHAFGDGGGCPEQGGLLFEFSNGFRWFGDSGPQWRTVMAYAPGERVAHFSNPNVTFDGGATGTADADNALTIDLSNDLVAAFRCAEEAECGDLAAPRALDDCNNNGFPDGCDIGSGSSLDDNGNGIPDECEGCLGDLDGSESVDFNDLLQLLAVWGQCPACPADLNFDGFVGFDDIVLLIAAWGDC